MAEGFRNEKALPRIRTRDTRVNVAAKKKAKKISKPSVSNTFTEIADKLKEHAKNELVDTNSPKALLLIIADAFHSAGRKH